MWELYNHRPSTDDRISETKLSNTGDCMQLGWFNDNDTALALYWNNSPDHRCVKDILTFANRLGLQKVYFKFFEEYENLFNDFDVEIKVDNVEVYKVI